MVLLTMIITILLKQSQYSNKFYCDIMNTHNLKVCPHICYATHSKMYTLVIFIVMWVLYSIWELGHTV